MQSATHHIHRQKQSQYRGFSCFPNPGSSFGQHAASVPVRWQSAEPGEPAPPQGFATSALSDPGHMDAPKAFKSLYFPHLETGIKMSFAYLFPASVITSVILGCSFLCRVLSSAKLQTHSGPPIHLIHKFKSQTEGLMKCSMSYS